MFWNYFWASFLGSLLSQYFFANDCGGTKTRKKKSKTKGEEIFDRFMNS